MNKTELIAVTAEHAGLTKKDTERVLNAAIDAITAALVKGEKVQLSGFGKFAAAGLAGDQWSPLQQLSDYDSFSSFAIFSPLGSSRQSSLVTTLNFTAASA